MGERSLKSGGWNYRVMRHRESSADNDEVFYAMHEVYYGEANDVKSWTQEPVGSPCGDTFEEMIGNLAWIMAGLTKPILDADTGKEVEPVQLLADDLQKMLGATP